jgi:hypothetical protein
VLSYSAVRGFWSVEELADGCTDCGEVAKGGCLVAGDFSVNSQLYIRTGRGELYPT